MSLIIPKLGSMSTSFYESHGLLHLNSCIEFTNVMDKMSIMSDPGDSIQSSESYRIPYKFALQDHNYGAPPPRTPSPPVEETTNVPVLQVTEHKIDNNSEFKLTQSSICITDTDGAGSILNTSKREVSIQEETCKVEDHISDEHDIESQERDITPNNVHVEDESITRCICDFDHDDGYMICCDKCFVWQHVDCMGLDRSNIPEEYLCEMCQPRKIDKERAMSIQIRKRQELGETSTSEEDDELDDVMDSFSTRRRADSKKSERGGKRRTSKSGTRGRKPQKERKLDGPIKRSKKTGRKTFRSKRSFRTEELDSPVQNQTFQLRDWIDNYEEAVTNHYSPELRARINNWKANGLSSNLKSGNQGQRCRVGLLCQSSPSSPQNSGLLALFTINQDQSIIEYRGKYLLLSQFKRQNPACRQYHPYVLHYQLTPGLDICVDARKYANDARFVRKSCRPNAEIRHVLDKGSIHLYIVATTSIHKDEEITIPFDKSCVGQLSCACGQSDCGVELGLRKNGLIADTAKKKKRLSGDPIPEECIESPRVKIHQPKIKVKEDKEELDEDSENTEDFPSPQNSVSGKGRRKDDGKSFNEKRKMTREERKMEAIMKAFERLEKLEQKKKDHQSHNLGSSHGKKCEENNGKGDIDENDSSRDENDKDGENSSGEDNCENKPKQRVWRRGRRASSNVASHRARINSGSSDITSPDESTHNSLSSYIDSMQNSPPGGHTYQGFRFPNMKKAIVNEWLSSPIDSATFPNNVDTMKSSSNQISKITSSMESKNTAVISGLRKLSEKQVEGSAKKRWLRQAISEESEVPVASDFCESPNSQADSPLQDYVTPLKKRRILRENSSLPLASSGENSSNAKNSLYEEVDDSCPSDDGGDTLGPQSDAHKNDIQYSNLKEVPESCNIADRESIHQNCSSDSKDVETFQEVRCNLFPTPKKKISILDYRKRKQVKDTQVLSSSQFFCESTVDQSDSDASSVMTPTPRDESYQEIVEELHQDLLPFTHPDKSRKDDIKWDSAPTLAELQQENVIERLKKEFGFKISKDSRLPGKSVSSTFIGGVPGSDLQSNEDKVSFVSCIMTKPPSPPPLPPPLTPPPPPTSPPLPSTPASNSPSSPVPISPSLNLNSTLSSASSQLSQFHVPCSPIIELNSPKEGLSCNDKVPFPHNCSPTSVISAPSGAAPYVTKCDQQEHSSNDQTVTVNRISPSPFCRSDSFSGILIEPGQPPPPGTNSSSVCLKYKLSKALEDTQCKLNKRSWPT